MTPVLLTEAVQKITIIIHKDLPVIGIKGGLQMRNQASLNWAVLGTGVIANEMACAMAQMGRRLYGVCNRTYEKAAAFGEKYGVEKVYSGYDALFSDPDADVIYITTPHNTHYGFIKQALEHGKHVLAEKSITLNSRELEELVGLADKKNLVFAEAMTIWHMPIYKKLWALIEKGSLGKVQMITANFGSFKEYDMNNRFFNRSLAGGALLDIGVYALSAVCSFMEETPDQVLSQMIPASTGVDEQATILLSNKKGQMAAAALSLHSKQPKRIMISCEKAYIEIMEYPRAEEAVITDAVTGERTIIREGKTEDALKYELLDMEAAVLKGDLSVMKLDQTQKVMALMTGLRREWGLVYPEEE